MSGNEPTPEAHSYGVGSAARLQLREEMPHVRLHRLLGEVEALSDLAVHETVRNQLQYLDLAGGRFLLELAQDRGANGITDPARPEPRRAAAASKRRLWSR